MVATLSGRGLRFIEDDASGWVRQIGAPKRLLWTAPWRGHYLEHPFDQRTPRRSRASAPASVDANQVIDEVFQLRREDAGDSA
jgi:hypothetical protein